jgi:hypothetical protein
MMATQRCIVIELFFLAEDRMTENVISINHESGGAAGNEVPIFISNDAFCIELRVLKKLRQFVIKESIKDKSKEPSTFPDLKLGQLEIIDARDPRADGARAPTSAEWNELNSKLQYFYGLLSESERRKFNFTLAAPRLKVMPMSLVAASMLFILAPALLRYDGVPYVSFLGWILTVGALGAIAFVLVNALGIQVDPTVDVTDKDSTMFRVLLGALFSVILTLPFGFPIFGRFISQVNNPNGQAIEPKEAAMLLLPFLFGFSTSLVLTVLNRLVESVQTFFGVSTKK